MLTSSPSTSENSCEDNITKQRLAYVSPTITAFLNTQIIAGATPDLGTDQLQTGS